MRLLVYFVHFVSVCGLVYFVLFCTVILRNKYLCCKTRLRPTCTQPCNIVRNTVLTVLTANFDPTQNRNLYRLQFAAALSLHLDSVVLLG